LFHHINLYVKTSTVARLETRVVAVALLTMADSLDWRGRARGDSRTNSEVSHWNWARVANKNTELRLANVTKL
jgi:hypothetical protein